MQMPMGQYRPGNTFFHRADAKGKLLGLCLVIAAVIVSKGLIGCIAAAAAALTVSYLAGISLRRFFTAGSTASGAGGFSG